MLVCGELSVAKYLPLHPSGRCCSLVVVEVSSPHVAVERFECDSYQSKGLSNTASLVLFCRTTGEMWIVFPDVKALRDSNDHKDPRTASRRRPRNSWAFMEFKCPDHFMIYNVLNSGELSYSVWTPWFADSYRRSLILKYIIIFCRMRNKLNHVISTFMTDYVKIFLLLL